MKFQKRETWKAITKMTMAVVAFFVVFTMLTSPVFAAGKATAKVKGNIRAKADTSSEVVGSVAANKKVDIISSITADDGYTWYKIYVDAETTGYIRADLLSDVTGSISTEKKTDIQEKLPTEETKEDDKKEDDKKEDNKKEDNKKEDDKKEDNKKETVGKQQGETQFVQITESTATAGTVKGTKINVRENPSTSAKKVGTVGDGKEVAILGEALDNSKAIWYQINYDNVTGFIRNDFIEVTSLEEEVEETVEEEVVEEETVEETPVNNDFEVKYEVNAEGVEEWFLYDNVKGVKQSLGKLLAFVEQVQKEELTAVSKLNTYKIIVVVLASLLIVSIVVVTILIFKLRDSYEYEYDDDDDDDDEEDDEDEDEEDEEEEVVNPRRGRNSRQPISRGRQVTERVTRNETTAGRTGNSGDNWQSRNFLEVDDDMEFEFLDIK